MAIDFSDITSFQDAVVTVMGLGRYKQGSGVGATKWLMRHGAQLVITDLKTEEELRSSIDEVMKWYDVYRDEYADREIYQPVFVMGEHNEEDFIDVDLVMQNPGVPRESKFVQLAKTQGVPVESDISLFFRFCPFPIYTVTGTRGKSTTTMLFGEILKQQHPKTVIAGNITRSPLEDLDWILQEEAPVPIVLELSSWLLESLEHIDTAPEIAVLTNLYEEHLNRYASFEDYVAAKALMFAHQTSEQFAVLNADQETVRSVADDVTAQKYWFSLTPLSTDRAGAYLDGDTLTLRDAEEVRICSVADMAMKGDHNVQNALAASMAAHLAGVPHDHMRQALQTFAGLPGRQEPVADVDGVTYINDTTATSPEGVVAALERFGTTEDAPIVLITGGTAKGLSYEAMGDVVRATCKFVVYLEGSATPDMMRAVGDTVPHTKTDSMEEAVRAAAEIAEAGDVVLLSPGTSSFELFKNEFDRGEQFTNAVHSLKNTA